MSERVRVLSLAELGLVPGGFREDRRFVREAAPPATVLPAGPEEDPETRAFAAGYAQGAADAEAAFTEALAQQDAARERIELAFGRLDSDLTRELEARLRDTVLALCAPLLSEYAANEEALAARVKIAAGMLARAADERVIRLHPEDLALLAARLPEDWHFEPDPALERGALRIEGSAGGVEDGPGTWARALSDALSAC
ncbi:FliH/SctL family protein [Novosphingobium sp.]|uniref:FliH/SctL family protein n=1 Tax=Novosphingobium sp. TaxID=1874826 RepID=UPI00263411FE|nr:FliH/SctL family protein [Novosphingobium sp.]